MDLLIDEYHLNLAIDPIYEMYEKIFILDDNYYTGENFSIVRLGTILKFFVANDISVMHTSYKSFFQEYQGDITASSFLTKRLKNDLSSFCPVIIVVADTKLTSKNKKEFNRFFPFWKHVRKELQW